MDQIVKHSRAAWRRDWAGAAAMLAVMAGCGSVGASEPGVFGDLREVGTCGPESFPARLPAPAALVDIAALTPELLDLAQSGDSVSGSAILSMGYQTDGINMRRDVIGHTLTPVIADSLQELVFRNRLELPATDQEWGVRLRIDIAEEIDYNIERREYCPPSPLDPQLEDAIRRFVTTGTRYRSGVRTRTVLMRVWVHPAGYVDHATVITGGARGSTLERELETFLRRYSFSPATVDGIPVHGFIDVPVRVRA
jgi:hypothetical protein